MGNLQNPAVQNQPAAPTGPVYIKNNLSALQVFKQTFAVDSNGAIANALLIGNSSPLWLTAKLGTTTPDQVHNIVSSSISAGTAGGYAEMVEYLKVVGMHVTKLQFYSTNTAVYGGSLFIGEMPVNGLPSPTEILLQPYATTLGGGGYDNTLVISDHPFLISRNFFMYLSNIPVSTTLTITYTVDYIGNGFTGNPTGN